MTATMQLTKEHSFEAELLDLLCADEQWLRAEFDAIVQAGGETDRPSQERCDVKGSGRYFHCCGPHRLLEEKLPRAIQPAVDTKRGRQRSPPDLWVQVG
jgi:hypothetical protein